MIGKLHAVAIAFTLSMTGFAANAAETAAAPNTAICSTPNYPTAWIKDGLEGTVHLALLVEADGSVKERKVVSSSGHRELDKATLRAGANCKFGAAPKGSDSKPGWTTVQYQWVVN
ncbi:energy transducer TonB [Pseudoduganella sp. OTU4001]|uniref:energy transducer TonB n=1 Tax=Pseudoduganella sp. OTU4001 TaxID=3043854 RepID=UPI00313C35C5